MTTESGPKRAPRLTFSRLTIPGTHGTWPHRLNWSFERWDAWYVALTWSTWQVTVIFTRPDPHGRREAAE